VKFDDSPSGIFGVDGDHETKKGFFHGTKKIGPMKNGSRNSQFVCDFFGAKNQWPPMINWIWGFPIREFDG
jgi:hypothetical protein